jgi:MoxR-like ATPase
LIKKFDSVGLLIDWLVRRSEPKATEALESLKHDPILGHQTGQQLISNVAADIAVENHVLLIGPRGCGKSYVARRAIEKLERPAFSELNEGMPLISEARLSAQGNKEFPRDYFFEPEYQFVKDNKSGELKPEIRPAPLFRSAEFDRESGALLYEERMDGLKKPIFRITRNDGKRNQKTESVNRIVLFLDEINRFNDGVLDSLLLLLEERKAIYRGEEVDVPVTVVATMNPPGYDASARSLSPPLLARFTTTRRLFTAGFPALVKEILSEHLAVLVAKRAVVVNTDSLIYIQPKFTRIQGLTDLALSDKATILNDIGNCVQEKSGIRTRDIRSVAAATLCFWGTPDEARPSTAYLDPDTRSLLKELSSIGGWRFRRAMDFIAEHTNFGPDARAARDWLARAWDKSVNKDLSQITQSEFAETMVDAVANKLVLRFSPDAKPVLFSELMQELSFVTQKIVESDEIDSILLRELS